MNQFWSEVTHDLSPYEPGEQLSDIDLVKLNTNEHLSRPSRAGNGGYRQCRCRCVEALFGSQG